MKLLKKYIFLFKIEFLMIVFKKCCGEKHIKIYQYIRKKKRNGLIKACNDYLPEGEYIYYWYVNGKSILTIVSNI